MCNGPVLKYGRGHKTTMRSIIIKLFLAATNVETVCISQVVFSYERRRVMNMLEALAAIRDNDMWARPKSWIGGCCAYCYTSGLPYRRDGYYFVPSARGGIPATIPDQLFEEWEIVEPEKVLSGE